jgi:DNA repair protein RecN (Recombination protein N)
MLDYIRVENFAVVERSEVRFSEGLNVFTGETGAGKSILIDAISLFMKRRIAESAIRNGKDQLVVEALFSRGDEEYIIRREMSRKKSLSFLNGRLIPFDQIKALAETLLNIYGQRDHVFLLNTVNHGLYLDQFSGSDKTLQKLAAAYQELAVAKRDLDELHQKNKEVRDKLDYINFQVQEIESLGLELGDDERLEQRLKILSSAEEIIARGNKVVEDFYQKEDALYNSIADNQKDIGYLKEIYPDLASYADEVERFYNLIPEITSSLSTIVNDVEYDEEELNRVEGKLFKLNSLKQKYSLDLDGLLKKRDDLLAEKDLLENIGFSIEEKTAEVNRLLDTYKTVNNELRTLRKKKGQELSRLIQKELALLEMDKARFEVKFQEIEPDIDNAGERGTDKMEFYFSSNPGQELARIKDSASGGELSRLMLALKSLIDEGQFSTYIFDEIDTGIGGKTAEFVGEKLRKIARGNQVICISHLPQIACFADRHFLISKEFKKNETFSSTRVLDENERISEIARLMAGSAVNDDVLNAARNLLNKRKN